MAVLVKTAATELWQRSAVLHLRGSVSARSWRSVTWPHGLRQLSFDDGNFNQSIVRVAWPASLHQLSLLAVFNQPIAGVAWPASLLQLSFGPDFDQPVEGVVFPASVQHLSFGNIFNRLWIQLQPANHRC